jgi:periplasmic protein TonB
MPDFTSRLDDAGRSTTEPTLRIGRLPSPVRTSAFKDFFSNIKDFLSERPANVKSGRSDVFKNPEFGEGIGDNFKEFFHSAPRGPVNSDLLVNWNAGFGGFWQNLRDLISPRKMVPLKTTSAPVAVPEIWSKNTQFTRVQALSLAFHVVVLVLIIVPFWSELMSPGTTQAKTMVVTPLDITSPYLPKLPPGAKKAGGGGGGGAHELLPASKGKLPKFSLTQIVPPKVKPPDNPKFAATPTVLGMPDMKLASPNMSNWGDPMSKVTNDSNGPGSGNGIGSGNGTGVGSGSGGGVGPGEGGGAGGGIFNAGTGGYGIPACIYCPQAQFSDEAVKAKYQGTVLLQAIITPDGRATEIRVLKGLGLGLDEKAVEAVRTWRFKPASGPNGKPASVRQTIEVTFHLY